MRRKTKTGIYYCMKKSKKKPEINKEDWNILLQEEQHEECRDQDAWKAAEEDWGYTIAGRRSRRKRRSTRRKKSKNKADIKMCRKLPKTKIGIYYCRKKRKKKAEMNEEEEEQEESGDQDASKAANDKEWDSLLQEEERKES